MDKPKFLMDGNVDDFLKQLRKSDLDFVADYFELVLQDYPEGFPDAHSDRYWEVGEEEKDISRLIDLAIMFGVEWEKDDRYD